MVLLLLLAALLLSPTEEAGKIIGGHEAKPHSRPYMAYLQIHTAENMFCGGFLVREDFVLTAAHCLGSSISVTLGAHNIKKQERTQQIITVRRAIPHPRYNDKTWTNDIMLLQLKRKAKVTTAVSPISLPRDWDTVNPGMLCSVAGWGRLDVDMSHPNKLQEVQLEVQRAEKCTSRYKYYRTTTQICAGDPGKRKSSFKVFTRISSFLPWIQTTMKQYELQGPD
ncbi:mast cell protease 3-like isoform 2-T2 [Dama dama]|uniref:mast cell protease 3-like isoform X2 n=1 Tax=Dama dama TaxID=30532 RepID=UPI002A35BDAB|nr:mast cell protease 3-like isoform X2 [Dama dama]